MKLAGQGRLGNVRNIWRTRRAWNSVSLSYKNVFTSRHIRDIRLANGRYPNRSNGTHVEEAKSIQAHSAADIKGRTSYIKSVATLQYFTSI